MFHIIIWEEERKGLTTLLLHSVTFESGLVVFSRITWRPFAIFNLPGNIQNLEIYISYFYFIVKVIPYLALTQINLEGMKHSWSEYWYDNDINFQSHGPVEQTAPRRPVYLVPAEQHGSDSAGRYLHMSPSTSLPSYYSGPPISKQYS